jgi:hypothetical protein
MTLVSPLMRRFSIVAAYGEEDELYGREESWRRRELVEGRSCLEIAFILRV